MDSPTSTSFARQFDDCSEKINKLVDSIPTVIAKAQTFQTAADNLAQLVHSMKQDVDTIRVQSQQAIKPILPLYHLRTKVCSPN